MSNAKQITITLPAELLKEFRVYKAATGTTLSGLLRVLLKEKLRGSQSLLQKTKIVGGKTDGNIG